MDASMLRLKSLLLIVILVLAQSGLLAHQSDIKAHQAGHHCEVCLHGVSLGHGVTSTPILFITPSATLVLRQDDVATVASAPVFVYSARAPPTVSSL
jgi:hypothetical protein